LPRRSAPPATGTVLIYGRNAGATAAENALDRFPPSADLSLINVRGVVRFFYLLTYP
jgi:hypothetical protein